MAESPTPYQYTEVFLCRKTTCCPKMAISGNKIIITDDYGGRIELSKEQIEILIDEYHQINPPNASNPE